MIKHTCHYYRPYGEFEGVTVCVQLPERGSSDPVLITAARCSAKDNFSKKIGRSIAIGRAEKARRKLQNNEDVTGLCLQVPFLANLSYGEVLLTTMDLLTQQKLHDSSDIFVHLNDAALDLDVLDSALMDLNEESLPSAYQNVLDEMNAE